MELFYWLYGGTGNSREEGGTEKKRGFLACREARPCVYGCSSPYSSFDTDKKEKEVEKGRRKRV